MWSGRQGKAGPSRKFFPAESQGPRMRNTPIRSIRTAIEIVVTKIRFA